MVPNRPATSPPPPPSPFVPIPSPCFWFQAAFCETVCISELIRRKLYARELEGPMITSIMRANI
eukprot:scaffold4827_cov109-Isochrysis_galbana.AAC.3